MHRESTHTFVYIIFLTSHNKEAFLNKYMIHTITHYNADHFTKYENRVKVSTKKESRVLYSYRLDK